MSPQTPFFSNSGPGPILLFAFRIHSLTHSLTHSLARPHHRRPKPICGWLNPHPTSHEPCATTRRFPCPPQPCMRLPFFMSKQSENAYFWGHARNTHCISRFPLTYTDQCPATALAPPTCPGPFLVLPSRSLQS
ncbi:hypothetical protein K461DRAFT_183746 [Myriangium duriaei CBS 260.36]|uniref:Uncharacterized protein n=1 Tax=Myriangium duriaei CBS 260.36 TaxID=1168546 RepID=A0A9P4IVS0_9PEZI|nr:hypothetical protein K461DRAFT_183746 [Myriangium duriaei CBS 260.36]